VLKGQRELGIPVPDGVIEAYEKVKDQINVRVTSTSTRA